MCLKARWVAARLIARNLIAVIAAAATSTILAEGGAVEVPNRLQRNASSRWARARLANGPEAAATDAAEDVEARLPPVEHRGARRGGATNGVALSALRSAPSTRVAARADGP